jgi:hypothetical protein
MSLLDALELPQASQYRARVSQLEAEARMASDELAAELRTLAAAYLRLSEFAELHETAMPSLDTRIVVDSFF